MKRPLSAIVRNTTAALLLAAALAAPAAPWRLAGSAAAATAASPVAYQLPLAGPADVHTSFSPPSAKYGPGHLGVDLAGSPDEPVRAAGAGTVTFAGQVAGHGVVVIAHPDGIRTEYEPLAVLVRAGTQVTGGELIGRIHGVHLECWPALCLHWGARRGTSYLDPLSLLDQPLGAVRLLPWAAASRSASWPMP